jgi:two-component system chemotaxis sensor kinase CheA
MAGLGADRVRLLFAQEADVRLAELGRLLLDLEQRPADQELVRSVYRELHTLKGSAAVAGLQEISQIAHGLEELVDDVRAGRRPVTAGLIDDLLQGADRLSDAVAASPAGQPTPAPSNGGQPTPRTRGSEPTVDAPVEPSAPPTEPSVRPERVVPSGPPEGGGAVIMVPVERLEDLTRLVGETASAHLRIGRMLKDRFDVDPGTCTEFNELARSLNNLHDSTMRTQMVPVSTVTDQLHRAARDLARAQGKDVQWETTGTDTELDRGVLHRLSDSLMHVVRNAIDHGIEGPEDRRRAGKPSQATLRLHAMQLGSEVIITVTDDGRGIDTEEVQREAQRRGIETEGLSDEELVSLTLLPGFSTVRFVSDVSGRGVGLDVVRSHVEAAHGRVDVRSEPGIGTEFRIMVPITVAVLRCLLVEAGGQSFALPFHRVLLTQAHEPDKVTYAEGRRVVWVGNHPLPLHQLTAVIGLDAAPDADGPVVVLADASQRHAFTVDRLVGQRDVVIKALSPLLPHLPALAGVSVEADGSILLVLDPPGLIQRARHSPAARRSQARDHADPADRRSILVVDDALIVRELQRGILERAGFAVRVAADGQQAIALLAEEPSDLVVTDIEMPSMDGFALTEAIRSHPTLAHIPVLIVSSRSSEADRQRGLDAGADGYIIKSAFDEGSLLTAVTRLLGTGS